MSWQTSSDLDSDTLDATASSEDAEALWSIAEIRDQAGVSARTLRYYEEVGLLPGVRRRAGGRRVYGPDELERLRFIGRLKALGLALAEIKELNAVYAIGGSTQAMLGRLDELLCGHRSETEARIEELATLRDEIDRYRQHIRQRIEAASGADEARDSDAPGADPQESSR